jgi:hypothetical protein
VGRTRVSGDTIWKLEPKRRRSVEERQVNESTINSAEESTPTVLFLPRFLSLPPTQLVHNNR